MSFEDGPQHGKASSVPHGTLLPFPFTPAEKHAALAAKVARMKQCLARVYVPYSSLQSEAYYELEASTEILALELAILDSQASLDSRGTEIDADAER